MNKKIFLTSFILLTLTLTACASSSGMAGPAAEDLSTQTKVTLGVLKLEDTDFAVTSEQAQELIPMFYVLQDLNESDTAAQEEIDGLVNQIQETLTDDQVGTIDGMSLSMRDVFSYTQSGGSGSSNASSTNSTNGSGDAGGPPDMGGGGFPGGGPGGMTGGAMPSSGTTSTGSDTTERPAMSMSTPSALFDSVIELLQKKVQS
ncbi:MAG: hypothetical protein JNM55_11450 [Anaerolineales bacterium]|nr:hypothetical protein [Anaerolineales bacterium]